MLIKVLLVIVFRRIKRRRGLQPGDDGRRVVAGQVRQLSFRRLTLFFVVVKQYRRVLRADVVALAVEGGGVVQREEGAQQGVVIDLGRVVADLHRFHVAAAAAADFLVTGVGAGAAGIAGNGAVDAGQAVVGAFDAPKTT